MAIEKTMTIDAHPSIYQAQPRQLKIYFSEPEAGIDESTGMLLLIAGYGGHANSNVYKKMRNVFADRYNLVTVQCDYFGWEFMQEETGVTFNFTRSELEQALPHEDIGQIYAGDEINMQKMIELGNKYKMSLPCFANLKEDLTNFNDMGIMQAIDNITAVISVIASIQENDFGYNKGKIIAYGHSHGAYLSYLCNAFAPNLFSLIIDNSAWIFPVYLTLLRNYQTRVENTILDIYFDYLAKKVPYDEEILTLPMLYNKFDNRCQIICYHGVNDNLINHLKKKEFCDSISNCIYCEITDEQVDGHTFKSTGHGLDADFLELFDFAVSKVSFTDKTCIDNKVVSLRTAKNSYQIDYGTGMPIMKIRKA